MSSGIRTEAVAIGSGEQAFPAFLAAPAGAVAGGVILVQEWWGLVDHIRDVAERFAREGYLTLAPDLYRGVTTAEPDEAGKLMMALDMDRASQDLVRAAEWLSARPELAGRGIGAVGFCMGGALALTLATDTPLVRAAVPFYGIPVQPPERLKRLAGPVLFIYAEKDGWASPATFEVMRPVLDEARARYEVVVYPGADHAFFNDERPEVHHPEHARDAWERTLRLFRANL